MKNSTQLFSTVSLLVLLSATPANLWAMTNEGTEDDTGTTTTALKAPEDGKTEVAPPKSGGLWSYLFGSSTPSEDVKKGGSTAVTPQDAANAAEDLKDATLKVLGMTREEFEKATSEDLETHIKNDALSDAERQFLSDAINAKSQQADLLLTASQLAAATPQELNALKSDPALSPDMQQLAASALEAKKEGGTEEEQAAKIVAKATEEWGLASTAVYYTLGAPVTLSYELMKGMYSGVTGAFSYAFGGSIAAEPQKDEKPQVPSKLSGAETTPVSNPQTEVTATEQETPPTSSAVQADSIVKQESEGKVVTTEEGSKPKKLTRQERRENERRAKQLEELERKEAEAKKQADKAIADLAALRMRLKAAQNQANK